MSGFVKGISFLSKLLDFVPTKKEKVVNEYMKRRQEIQARLEERKANSAKLNRTILDARDKLRQDAKDRDRVNTKGV